MPAINITKTKNTKMRTIFISLLLTCVLMSCQKDPKTSPILTGDKCKLIEVRNHGNKMISSFEYLSDNKIHKIINYDTLTGKVDFYSLFDYRTNLIVKSYYNSDDHLGQSEHYFLNDQGNAIKKSPSHNNIIDTTYFEYDSDGYLVKSTGSIGYNYFDTLSYKYSEGKRMLAFTNPTFQIIDSTKYEYYDFKIPQYIKTLLYNRYESFSDPIDREMFLGKNTDLALKSRSKGYTNDPHHIIEYRYYYEFDLNNNLTKIKSTIGYKNSYILHSYEMNVRIECQ